MSMLFMKRAFDSTDKTTEPSKPISSSKPVVLITEAHQGVGLAIAHLIASNNTHHVLLACHPNSDVQQASGAFHKTNFFSANNFHILRLDSTSQSSLSTAFGHVNSSYGRLDVLINHTHNHPRPANTHETLTSIFASNVTGPVCVTEAFLPLLKRTPSSQVIYWSSENGSLGLSSESHGRIPDVKELGFAASSSAINMVMVQQAKLFAEHDIKVWAIDPGDTRMCLTGEEDEVKNAARLVLDVILGKRDQNYGKVVCAGGTRPW